MTQTQLEDLFYMAQRERNPRELNLILDHMDFLMAQNSFWNKSEFKKIQRFIVSKRISLLDNSKSLLSE